MADYDFRGLSPIDFEALIRDLLQAETGRAFTTFAVGRDGGIDCRSVAGTDVVVAQCKHRPDASRTALASAATKELVKATDPEFVKAGQTLSGYYFATSADLTPDGVDEIAGALGHLVSDSSYVWTRGRINAALASAHDVERRHFKLWLNSAEVFERIVGSGEWERNEAFMQGVREHVRVWVHTPSYGSAYDALREQHVVIVAGPPGVGKSTLAEMLLITHWEAGYKVVQLTSDIAQAWRHLREPEEKVVFYYDDFLGQNATVELGKNESSELGQLIRTLQRSRTRNALLVMTTREQVLNTALHSGDDRVARALASQTPVRVQLSELTRSQRAQMLVNHLYFAYEGSDVLPGFADDLRYRDVVDHPGFNPRLLESVLLQRPPTIDDLYATLFDALNHPDSIWSGSFTQLTELAFRIVLHLAIDPDRSLPEPAVARLVSTDDDPREYTRALRMLEGTWIRIAKLGRDTHVALFDASRRDFLLDRLKEPTLFASALRHASSPRQVEYMLRQRPRDNGNGLADTEVAAVEQRTVDLLGDALTTAEQAERSRAASRIAGETFDERMGALVVVAGILSSLSPSAAPLLTAAFEAALKFLDDEFEWGHEPTSATAFELATLLDGIDEDWSRERAEDAATVGALAVSSTDDLRELSYLDYQLRQRIASIHITSAVSEAVQSNLDSIPLSWASPSSMMEALEELESVASDLDVDIHTDALRERIETMPEPEPENGDTDGDVRRLPNPYAGGNSNAAIASLFDMLRLDDPRADG
ncbi:hypothetical protein DEI93_00680 [Curtobacterium sp. MCBD17_035]|uniref:nSTAND3 domain-containing NTPase n=1 Tax=Curtobacterium sp. MCBD17_035 TaxID=2175673 RepID=UPI000DA767C1|nr:hypothetical protein [Curtobacterium sp. MCBD17_035]WIB67581.1 hypothetical protein DEI93_00680 [Curtobacterium sp. MCBD17_035]